MRAVALLVAFLLAAGGLAGCIGSEKDSEDDNDVTPNTLPGASGGAGGVVKVLAPLTATLSFDGGEWVKSGSSVAFEVSEPANAQGDVAYTWAVGPLPGTAEVQDAGADTGSASADEYIQAGESASLTYEAAGIYRMHCHPHAWMRHNVTVVEGVESPSTVHVQIVDGTSLGEYRYVPEEILIAPGTTVVYHNNGTQAHTSTAMMQEPALTALPIDGASGTATIEGEGWQRVVVVMQDADGRIGTAETKIYTTSELPAFSPVSVPFEFTAGGLPQEAAEPPVVKKFTLEQNATIFLNWSAQDALAANGAPENMAEIEIHIKAEGVQQDTMTVDGPASGSESARAQAGTYTITISAKNGASVSGEAIVEAVLDLDPPAPETASAGGGHEGHGGGGGGGHNH